LRTNASFEGGEGVSGVDDDVDIVVEVLRLLADPTRVRVLLALHDGEPSVGDLASGSASRHPPSPSTSPSCGWLAWSAPRWTGHRLEADPDVAVASDLDVAAGHRVAQDVHHALLHRVRHLEGATVHVHPPGVTAAHAATSPPPRGRDPRVTPRRRLRVTSRHDGARGAR
jgi:hypothetical protein